MTYPAFVVEDLTSWSSVVSLFIDPCVLSRVHSASGNCKSELAVYLYFVLVVLLNSFSVHDKNTAVQQGNLDLTLLLSLSIHISDVSRLCLCAVIVRVPYLRQIHVLTLEKSRFGFCIPLPILRSLDHLAVWLQCVSVLEVFFFELDMEGCIASQRNCSDGITELTFAICIGTGPNQLLPLCKDEKCVVKG